jgi:uncharacterized protein (TIGR00251 family)
MRLQITVKPNARRESVTLQPDGSYKVALNAPPRQGEANQRLIELLADFFKVAKSSVRILHGATGKTKLVEIDQ